MADPVSSLQPGDFLRSPSPPLRSARQACQYAVCRQKSMKPQTRLMYREIKFDAEPRRPFSEDQNSRATNERSAEKTYYQGPLRRWMSWRLMSSSASREHVRRMRIKLAALRRHEAARDPATGKSTLAVAAGQASGRIREGDRVWGLESALKRWHPRSRQDPDECNDMAAKGE